MWNVCVGIINSCSFWNTGSDKEIRKEFVVWFKGANWTNIIWKNIRRMWKCRLIFWRSPSSDFKFISSGRFSVMMSRCHLHCDVSGDFIQHKHYFFLIIVFTIQCFLLLKLCDFLPHLKLFVLVSCVLPVVLRSSIMSDQNFPRIRPYT